MIFTQFTDLLVRFCELLACFFYNSCIVVAFTNISNHIHKQPDPEQLPTCRSYKYLFLAGIKSVTRSAKVDHSATVPILPFVSLRVNMRNLCGTVPPSNEVNVALN